MITRFQIGNDYWLDIALCNWSIRFRWHNSRLDQIHFIRFNPWKWFVLSRSRGVTDTWKLYR